MKMSNRISIATMIIELICRFTQVKGASNPAPCSPDIRESDVAAVNNTIAWLYLKMPEVTRRNTRMHFIRLEGVSAADLVKSMRTGPMVSKEQVA
jgi:hypothetical protein